MALGFAIGSAVVGALAGATETALVSGPFGVLSRSVIEKAAQGTVTIPVVTNLTSKPEIGRALSVAIGNNAEGLAAVARQGGTLYKANIPSELVLALQQVGLAEEKIVEMAGQVGREIRFLPAAAEFVVPFFK